MLNKVILAGNIGRDPEYKINQNGREVGSFFLATSSSWKDSEGEWHTHTDWHRITIFRESPLGWIKGFLKKGDKVYIEGKLTYQQAVDQYNQPKVIPHVVISGYEGKIQHIRSSSPSYHEKSENLQEQMPTKESSLSDESISTKPTQPEKEKIQ